MYVLCSAPTAYTSLCRGLKYDTKGWIQKAKKLKIPKIKKNKGIQSIFRIVKIYFDQNQDRQNTEFNKSIVSKKEKS